MFLCNSMELNWIIPNARSRAYRSLSKPWKRNWMSRAMQMGSSNGFPLEARAMPRQRMGTILAWYHGDRHPAKKTADVKTIRLPWFWVLNQTCLESNCELYAMLWTVHATCMGTLGGDEAAPQLQVLDRYFLPEPVWLAGPWDSAACSCSGDADSAMETSEVTCSRGSWLLCSGRVLLLTWTATNSHHLWAYLEVLIPRLPKAGW